MRVTYTLTSKGNVKVAGNISLSGVSLTCGTAASTFDLAYDGSVDCT